MIKQSPCPDTFEELKSITDRTDSFRYRFAAKLFLMLNFVEKHPEYVEQVGCKWAKDGVNFFINSNVMSKYLGILPNSVNSNLRDLAFTIVKNGRSELIKQINTNMHWTIRTSSYYAFKRETTFEEVESYLHIGSIDVSPMEIDPLNGQETVTKVDFGFIPAEIKQAIGDDSQILAVTRMLLGLPFDKKWIDSFLKKAVEQWKKLSEVNLESLNKVVCCIFPNDPTIPQEYTNIYRSNLKHVLRVSPNSSQFSENVSFESFFIFFARYCHGNDLVSTIMELSKLPDNEIFDLGMNSEFDDDNDPHFIQGFCPWMERAGCINTLMNHPDGSWCVIEDGEFNQFTVFVKKEGNIVAVKVECNSISPDDGHFYQVNFSEDFAFASTWNELLFEVLNLDKSSGISFKPASVSYVSAERFIEEFKESTKSNFDDSFDISLAPFSIFGSQRSVFSSQGSSQSIYDLFPLP